MLVTHDIGETGHMNSIYARIQALFRAVRDGTAEGQGLVEYAAILGFVAACMVVAILYLEPNIALSLNRVTNSFP